MRTTVILVDAGYLYAQGGLALYGTRSRNNLALDAARFLNDLSVEVAHHSSTEVLRTYWYDAATHGIPTDSQLEIGRLPYVKLRLGYLQSTRGGSVRQKGVDALIYRDLMTLATERVISHAFLLAGDDDLREGVIFAQDRGILVTLIGIQGRDGRTNQSHQIQLEVDNRIELRSDALRESLQVAPVDREPSSRPTTSLQPLVETAVSLATNFAERWLTEASSAATHALRMGHPEIPNTLDVELLRHVERGMGRSMRDSAELREAVRRAFWDEITRGES